MRENDRQRRAEAQLIEAAAGASRHGVGESSLGTRRGRCGIAHPAGVSKQR
jgi:hypothetical protein